MDNHDMRGILSAMMATMAAAGVVSLRSLLTEKDAVPDYKNIDKNVEKLLKELLELKHLEVLSDKLLMRLRTAKYLLVIDMGCGSTSAAVLMLEAYRKDKGSGPIVDYIFPLTWSYFDPLAGDAVDNLMARPSIPTMIGYKGIADMTPIIGPEALLTGYVCENFKNLPDDLNLKEDKLVIKDVLDPAKHPVTKNLRDIWQDYFCALLKTAFPMLQHRLSLEDPAALGEDFLVMVAHPAGKFWSKSVEAFKSLILAKTGLPEESVLTVSEARAAMQYVRRHPNHKTTLDFAKGVIIIDIGASTIDVEYLNQNIKLFMKNREFKPPEYSLTMAGRDADRLLAHYVLEQLFLEEMRDYPEPDQIPEEDFFFQKNLVRARFLHQIRSIKEFISTNKVPKLFRIDNRYKKIEIYPEILCALLGDEQPVNPLQGGVYGDKAFSSTYTLPMARFVNGPDYVEMKVRASWYGHLGNIILYSMSELNKKGLPVGKVIVTGGSCQLLGVRQHISKAINAGPISVEEENIIYLDRENDYENAVPFGGAFYVGGLLGHIDELVGFPEKLRSVLRTELKEVAANKIAAKIFSYADTVLINALDWWCDDKYTRWWWDKSTINHLKQRIANEKETYFDQPRKNQLLTEVDSALKSIDFNVELLRTKQIVTALLDHLADKSFTGKPNLKAAEINIPDLDKLLSQAIDSIHLNDLAPGFFLKDPPGNDETLGRGRRRRARDNYKNGKKPKEDVKKTLNKKISDLLHKDIEKTDIFSIPDQILDGLHDDIVCALYMNK